MKTLFLVRHAKSSWKETDLSDKDRPLNKRGKHDAPVMGKLLKKMNVQPDLLISSPAVRALTTALNIANEIDYPNSKIDIVENIYMASATELLNEVSKSDDKLKSIMLFGHNPGITDFLNGLSTANIDNMPTCSIVCIQFEINSWSDIKNKKGKVVFFEYPKKLK
jgi:phosphohistidine phosphatase